MEEFSDAKGLDVLYLTLNYDLFLDRALEDHYTVLLDSTESYCDPSRNWNCIKLHGSVNWSVQVGPYGEIGSDWPQVLRKYHDRFPLESEIVVLKKPSLEWHYDSMNAYYPALALPLGGMKKHICPHAHSSFAETFVADCEDFLIIGMSARDGSIRELLAKAKRVNSVTIANGKTSSGEEALQLIGDSAPVFSAILNDPEASIVEDWGFSQFMNEDSIGELLEKIISRKYA